MQVILTLAAIGALRRRRRHRRPLAAHPERAARSAWRCSGSSASSPALAAGAGVGRGRRRPRRRRRGLRRRRRSPSASALLGGGDVKLLAAGALWLGAAALGPFLLATVLAGGVLAVAFLLAGLLRRRAAGAAAASLPYGIAIAAGGILVSAGALWT